MWFIWGLIRFMWFISRIQISCIPTNATCQHPHTAPAGPARATMAPASPGTAEIFPSIFPSISNQQWKLPNWHIKYIYIIWMLQRNINWKKKLIFDFNGNFSMHLQLPALSLPPDLRKFCHSWVLFLLTSESPARCAYTGGAEHTSPGLKISCIKSWAQHNGNSEMLPTAACCMSYCFDICCTCSTLNKFYTAWIQHLRVYIDIVGTKW